MIKILKILLNVKISLAFLEKCTNIVLALEKVEC